MNAAIKIHGGKHYLAPKIVKLFPAHTRYLEPYAGGLSVLFAKQHEDVSEYVNDMNGDLINFWRVLRNTPDRMLRALWGTPLSQDEFIEAKNYLADTSNTDNVKRATAFFICTRQSRQGLGKDYCTPTTRTRRGMNESVSAWLSAIEGLPEIHERLKRVEIYNQPAVGLIKKFDAPGTLMYLDPPYYHPTRSTTKEYGKFEMDEAAHVELLETICKCDCYILLSGYPSDLYSRYLSMWKVHSFPTANHASSSKEKETKPETVWANF